MLERILSMLASARGREPGHRVPHERVVVSGASETGTEPREGVGNIVLHVGLPKTGTTLIQNWALANCNSLAAEGIFALPTELEAHRLAVECITDETRLKDPDIILNIKSLSFDAARQALLEGTSREGVRTSVVSSEYFFVADPARVAAMFAGMGVGVSRVVCFVRRQDDLLASGYNQDIKGLGSARAFIPPAYLRIYDWYALREDWQRAFPGADMVLNNFDHHRVHDTLIDVFARNIGATSTHQVPALPKTNESLCAELLEIVRVANAAGLFEIARLAVAAQDAGLTGTPFAFAEPVRQAILESYRESNTRIAAADPQGEFADFACDARARHGADMTGVFRKRSTNPMLVSATHCPSARWH